MDTPKVQYVWEADPSNHVCTPESVPTLADWCIKTIRNNPKCKALECLLAVYSKLDSGNPIYTSVRAYAVQRLGEQYPMLYEKYGFDELKLVFAAEELERFEAERKQALEVKNRFASLKGTIIEPVQISCEKTDDGSYPVQVRVQGAAWPADVNPSKREEYLSDQDFVSVFKMTKQELSQKDKFVKLRLKKEHKLF